MRRVYLYLAMVLSTFTFVSCVIDDAESRDPERVAQTIWSEAHADLRYINKMLTDVVHFDHMLQIEDDSQRDKYFDIYFGQRTELEERGNGYVVKRMSNYDMPIYTYYITNRCALGEGEWTVRYEGGNDYTMTLTPQEDGSIEADISSLYVAESEGSAILTFDYLLHDLDQVTCNAEVELCYEGSIELVDRSMGESKPLTISTRTLEPVVFSDQWGFKGGKLRIECRDEFYGSRDEVDAEFFFDPQRVDLTYLGVVYTKHAQYGI